MSELEEYAGCDGLTSMVGHIIMCAVLFEQVCYGDYFVGNPRHVTYVWPDQVKWTTID